MHEQHLRVWRALQPLGCSAGTDSHVVQMMAANEMMPWVRHYREDQVVRGGVQGSKSKDNKRWVVLVDPDTDRPHVPRLVPHNWEEERAARDRPLASLQTMTW